MSDKDTKTFRIETKYKDFNIDEHKYDIIIKYINQINGVEKRVIGGKIFYFIGESAIKISKSKMSFPANLDEDIAKGLEMLASGK